MLCQTPIFVEFCTTPGEILPRLKRAGRGRVWSQDCWSGYSLPLIVQRQNQDTTQCLLSICYPLFLDTQSFVREDRLTSRDHQLCFSLQDSGPRDQVFCQVEVKEGGGDFSRRRTNCGFSATASRGFVVFLPQGAAHFSGSKKII